MKNKTKDKTMNTIKEMIDIAKEIKLLTVKKMIVVVTVEMITIVSYVF